MKVEAYLIDLDGTLYNGKERIEGAKEFIEQLRQRAMKFQFLTNNSSRTSAQVAEHLNQLGIEAYADEVCTSSQATAAYVAAEHPHAHVYLIGEQGIQHALAEQGILFYTSPEQIPVGQTIDFVVQGIDRAMTYDKLACAVTLILKGQAKFISTNPDKLLPTEEGLKPGAGTIAAMIEAATGVKPVVIGKPSKILSEYALAKVGTPAQQTLIIGDNPFTDIAAGVHAGMPTALVLTGLVTSANIEQLLALAGVTPDVVVNRLTDIQLDENVKR